MKTAMILAAGRGERMRPLTDHTPKPLLSAGGKPLIAWHLERLAAAGFEHVVINHAHLGDRIESAIGDGARWGLRISYSPEAEALETGGGIFNALPLIDTDPFLVLNGDVWVDALPKVPAPAGRDLAFLWLVDNPGHNPGGDFVLDGSRVHDRAEGVHLTFSGVGVYRRALFAACSPGRFGLAPLLREAMRSDRVAGARLSTYWEDIGTPQRLAELDRRLAPSLP